MQRARMEGNHYVNWNSIIYRKAAIQRIEQEAPFLPAKGFNTNLVQFPNFYHCIILLLVTSMPAISHMHGYAPTMVLLAQNLVHKKV